MIRRVLLAVCITLFILPHAFSQNISITQLDNRSMLLDGTMDLYFLFRGGDGKPAKVTEPGNLKLFNLLPEGTRSELSITSLEQEAPRQQGINFLLLVDNSGSMHDEELDGAPRYETARYAVDHFLQEIDNPHDKVGIVSFNSYYSPLIDVSPITEEHSLVLNSIHTPTKEESYTELYRSMVIAGDQLAPFSGRRAMIVLSDGENYPYSNSGNSHPVYGNSDPPADAVVSKLMEEGITLYAVHIGKFQDKALNEIALKSGGRNFSADSKAGLSGIYTEIRDEIRQEYKLSFRAPYVKSDTGNIVLALGSTEAEGSYFTPHFLAAPSDSISPFIFLPLLIGIGIVIILLFVVWEKPVAEAELSMLPRGKNFSPSTRISLAREVTVIGAGNTDDMTIAGNPGLKTRHAAVKFNKADGSYTLVSDNEFRVNNRIKTQHRLKSGDVIDLEGTTIVFDKPLQEKQVE